jgi:hypothetical protein
VKSFIANFMVLPNSHFGFEFFFWSFDSRSIKNSKKIPPGGFPRGVRVTRHLKFDENFHIFKILRHKTKFS